MAKAKTEETDVNPEPEIITYLRPLYPTNKTFYQTGDGLIFLEDEKKEAEAHQRIVGRGEISTY